MCAVGAGVGSCVGVLGGGLQRKCCRTTKVSKARHKGGKKRGGGRVIVDKGLCCLTSSGNVCRGRLVGRVFVVNERERD